jgi:hypothetical protein
LEVDLHLGTLLLVTSLGIYVKEGPFFQKIHHLMAKTQQIQFILLILKFMERIIRSENDKNPSVEPSNRLEMMI